MFSAPIGGAGGVGGSPKVPPPSSLKNVSPRPGEPTPVVKIFFIGSTVTVERLVARFPYLFASLTAKGTACYLMHLTLKGVHTKVQLRATNGQERLRFLPTACLQGTSAFAYILNLDDRESLASVRSRLTEVTAKRPPSTFAGILIGSTASASGKTTRAVLTAEGAALAAEHGIPYFETEDGKVDDAVRKLATSALLRLPLIASFLKAEAAEEQEKLKAAEEQEKLKRCSPSGCCAIF